MDADSRARLKGYIDVAYRRKWWVMIPVLLSIGATPVVFEQLPKKYRASTSILVSPQTFSEQVAQSTVTGVAQDRLASLAIQILSRTYLETVVEDLELVPAGASERQRESAAARLKDNVELEHDTQNLSWFRVVAHDEDPERTAAIANRLADLFIEQNRLWREEQASDATRTVDSWLDQKKAQLDAEEKKIAAYQRQHLFELPSQLGANLQLLNAANSRHAVLTQDIRSRQDLLSLHLAQMQARSEDPMSVPLREMDPAIRGYVELNEQLRQLRSRYTEENPAVKSKVAEIEDFKKLHPELEDFAAAAEKASSVGGDAPRLKREIAALEEQRDEVQREIDLYTQRVNKTPIHEQALASLTRDYDSLKKEYDDLLRKKEFTVRGEDLEASMRVEQFKVQDRARVPRAPYSPKFIVVLFFCVVMGTGAGVGVTVLLEFFDQTFRTEEEVKEAFPGLPVLGTIPKLDTGPTHGKGKSRGGREAAALMLAAAVSLMISNGMAQWWTC